MAQHHQSIIQASVGDGPKARNQPDDVRVVQHLLNRCSSSGHGPEDGVVSPVLVNRIRNFQFATLHFHSPDGRVDPHGRTLSGLLRQSAVAPKPQGGRSAASSGAQPMTGAGSIASTVQRAAATLLHDEQKVRRVTRPTSGGSSGGGGGTLSSQDYQAAAAQLGAGVDPALLRAFAEVESGGKAALGPNGLPVIAYEGHIFRRYTHARFDAEHPLLSYPYRRKAGPEWRVNNKTQQKAWETLEEAMGLAHDPALMACSWGMFQVMGFNFKGCGYADVTSFVDAMKQGARGQIGAFVGFCRSTSGMISAMQRQDYSSMASHYNGSDYGDYATRIQRAHAKYKGR